MELIIGGAYQGKGAYARKIHPNIQWVDGDTCAREEIGSCRGMEHFEQYIRRCLEEEGDVSDLAEQIIEKNPGIVLICGEMGYGVVPMDPFDRKYREAVGRVCTRLAAFSKKVHRVVCGVGTVIKDD